MTHTQTQGADGAGTKTVSGEPGRAAFARWSSLQPEFQDRIWTSMSDDVRAFWARQEIEQAGVTAAGVMPWKTGQSGYAREAMVLDAEEQALEIGVTTAGRIDLIIHNRAGDGFDDLTARMSRKDACRVVAALVEAGASEAPKVLWSAWPEDDCDSDPRIDPMAQKVTEWFVGRWPLGADEPECRILVGEGRSAEIVARRIAEKLTSVLNTDAIQARTSTPAPAATPGVPDSLRALSEAACPGRFKAIRGLHEYAVATEAKGQKGPLNSADADFAAASANFVRALISAETAATPYGWTYIWTSDDCDGGAVEQKFSRTKPDATNPYISDIVPLFASHPAGQSAGQGELIRSLQIELSIAQGANRALKEWIKGYRIKGRFQALGQLPTGQAGDPSCDFQMMLARLISRHSKGLDITQTIEGARDLLKRKGTLSPLREEPAPNSTRTGAAEMEDAWEALQQIKSTGRTTRFRANSEQDWKNAVVRMEREAEAALAARPEAPSDAGWRGTHRLPDADAPRHSWNHVKHMVAKSRAAALKEAAELARIHALICGTTRQEIIGSVDTLTAELKKLAKEASDALARTPPSDPAPSGQAEG